MHVNRVKLMTYKTRIAMIASVAILIAAIAGIQTIEVQHDAYAADGSVPSWVKKTTSAWASDKITDSTYLDAIAWLINHGIIVVDTATAESMGPVDTKISGLTKDVEKLEDRIDELESSSDSSVSKDEFYYRVFEAHPAVDCDKTTMGMVTIGWCPDSDQKRFDIQMPPAAMDAEEIIVRAVSSEGPLQPAGCEVFMLGEDEDTGKIYAGVWCDEAPQEDSPMHMLAIDVHGEEGFEDLWRTFTTESAPP